MSKCLAALLSLLCLSGPALATSDLSIAGDSVDEARAWIEANRDHKAPDGFQLALGLGCDSDQCVIDQAMTLLAMKGAYKGDYGDQRNLALCLSTGCGGAIIAKPMLGCAWRIVILASGHTDVGEGDVKNGRNDCGKLSEAERLTAAQQSERLFEAVYGRPMGQ